ncbi:MAG TPA: tetratricopeptide repeat protein [Spirochaetota bacterium]|nr:tetratricopeptide repeat protein [Spirochaetota bacterium]HPC41410.1 tetratricopeptide repeat protein [Spirochaetota bacterium]HPL17054.1 tetratricopeptide repeat protein [Spirochaetota bacterium]HQF09207.1 tetratricopeptide repeat protein [Spirochaetota bacterium]HQH97748.1 tetratricopeptide repeat protein [Spirochaetota bacterium]
MTRFAVILALCAPLAVESCYCYRAVTIERTHGLYRTDAAGVPVRAARFRLPVGKVLAREGSLSPSAFINNRAVDLALQGRYGEAEILFREVLAEDARDAAALNNLGVICEAGGDRDGAFKMYIEACRIEPDNAAFRKNFQSFADYRDGKE